MSSPPLLANDLILFARVVEAGSFVGAAEATGLPKATLSRRLAQLDNELGERLLQRSTRRLVLTEFGEHMLGHARHLCEEAEAASQYAQHRRHEPQGLLRVSLPPEFRELSLVDIISGYFRAYPNVRLELDLSSRRVDLIAERYDLAVRVAERLPDDSTLVARPIRLVRNRLYASPGYLARNPPIASPDDLLAHVGLMLAGAGGERQAWRLTRESEKWEGAPRRTLSANSLGLQQALAEEGLGIVALGEHFASLRVREGRLAEVLPEWHAPPVTIWAVTPGRHLLPQRTLAFIEQLRQVLGEDA